MSRRIRKLAAILKQFDEYLELKSNMPILALTVADVIVMNTQYPNKADYDRLLDECCKVAGQGDFYWNERYLSALEKRGLTLAVTRHPGDLDEWYPNNRPMLAPLPYHQGPYSWPVLSLVVWCHKDNH